MTVVRFSVKKLLKLEWEFIAGLLAAVAALVMHFLHLVNEDVLIIIIVTLIALQFLRSIRQEQSVETTVASVVHKIDHVEGMVRHLSEGLSVPEVVLLGPHHLRTESERFCREARGEMLWFHVCLLMFRTQALFDILLKPAIENPAVTGICFVLDERQRDLWETEIVPKLNRCEGQDKVIPPQWTSIEENISFILSDLTDSSSPAALVSFWGEPFMAYTVQQGVPRYILYVKPHSDLVPRLTELARKYRLGGN